jgi:hypothetical protein
MLNARYKVWLLEYFEGTLDDHRRSLLEARLAVDAELAAEAESLRRTIALLQATAKDNSPGELTRSYWPSIEARLAPAQRPILATPMRLAWGGGLTAAAAVALTAFGMWHPLSDISKDHTMVAMNMAVPTAPEVGIGSPPANVLKPDVVIHLKPEANGVAPKDNIDLTKVAPLIDESHSNYRTDLWQKPVTRPIAVSQKPPAVSEPPVTMMASADTSSDIDKADARTAFSRLNVNRLPDTAGVDQAVSDVSSTFERYSSPMMLNAATRSTDVSDSGPGGALPRVHIISSGGAGFAGATARPLMSSSAREIIDSSRVLSVSESIDTLRSMARHSLARRDTKDALEMWRDMLLVYLTPPVYGDNSSVDLAQQTLVEVRSHGFLPEFRGKIERQQLSQPDDVIGARVLGLTYSVQGNYAMARDKWWRVVTSSDACGEDWFQLGQANDHLNNSTETRNAYLRATEPDGLPLGSAHRNIAEAWLEQH